MKASSLPMLHGPLPEAQAAAGSPFPVAQRGKFIKQFTGPMPIPVSSASSSGNSSMPPVVLFAVRIASFRPPPTSASIRQP